MREVEVSRFVRATPRELTRALTPERLVEYEGSFAVHDVTDADVDDAKLVRVGARGLELTLLFESTDDGFYYTQAGEAGPFESMETWVTIRAENDGSRVTMRSAVSLDMPIRALGDRLGAWKRRGELKRALANMASDFG